MSNNVKGGHLARGAGKSFEVLFELHCRQKMIACVRIPDGCRRINTPSGLKLIPVQSPFDFVICKNGKAACIDTKTVNSNRFSHSHIDQDQLSNLSDVSSQVAAGLLIWFRESDRICFFDTKELKSLVSRSSLSSDGGLYLGSIDEFDPGVIISTYSPEGLQGTLI